MPLLAFCSWQYDGLAGHFSSSSIPHCDSKPGCYSSRHKAIKNSNLRLFSTARVSCCRLSDLGSMGSAVDRARTVCTEFMIFEEVGSIFLKLQTD